MVSLVKDAKERLHEQGGRMTSQRLLILETLETLDCHPTAEELFAVVNDHDPSLNLSTIYRTLRWLEHEGLVSSRRFDDDSRQERFDPVMPTEHHHFLCSSCKNVIEFDDPEIDNIKARFEEQNAVAVETISVVLYGICDECLNGETGSENYTAVGMAYGT